MKVFRLPKNNKSRRNHGKPQFTCTCCRDRWIRVQAAYLSKIVKEHMETK
jgi:hypothetical protein